MKPVNPAYNLLSDIRAAADQHTDGYENSGNWQDIRDGLGIVLRAMERNASLSGDNIATNDIFDQYVWVTPAE